MVRIYLKELLRDVIELKSTLEEKVDMLEAIKKAKQIDELQVKVLIAFISGYSVSEIANIYKLHSKEVKRLIKASIDHILEISRYEYYGELSIEDNAVLDERLFY